MRFVNYANAVLRAYRFRLYPNEGQKVLIEKHIGSCRFVWNHFLDFRNRRYTETGKGIRYNDMAKLLPSMKKEHEWLNEINSQSLQQTLMNLDTSFDRFFRKLTRHPVFRKKRNGKEVFLYLKYGEVEKTSNIAEQHFSIMSWLFKKRFKTKEGLLRTSYWYHHYLSTGM